MLIYAEVIANNRLQVIVGQFLKCNIIATSNLPAFNSIIESAKRLRNSIIPELVLITVVYTIGHTISTHYLSLGVASWFAPNINDITKMTFAGYWYVYLSLPIFQFILLR
jgi:hypothetical protein